MQPVEVRVRHDIRRLVSQEHDRYNVSITSSLASLVKLPPGETSWGRVGQQAGKSAVASSSSASHPVGEGTRPPKIASVFPQQLCLAHAIINLQALPFISLHSCQRSLDESLCSTFHECLVFVCLVLIEPAIVSYNLHHVRAAGSVAKTNRQVRALCLQQPLHRQLRLRANSILGPIRLPRSAWIWHWTSSSRH